MKNIYTSLRPVRILRTALTIFFLVIVWKNAHWSVALTLTLMSVAIEGLAFSVDILSKAFRAHLQGMREAFKTENHDET